MIRYPLYVTIDNNIFDSIGYDLGDSGIKNSGDYIFRCFQQSFVIMSRVL